ncbi:hypothetical protein LQ772_15465 [Frateuria edaphi]|uniref:hypothetical protein n=1 Tax=Frateuria edaphi TaxID=2898793 RepID=UPI001E58E8A2|nr:hypothetical protein [Frateuria edaphi]UGB45360.1 hypothetical protein LQ772_15465 [Frateuria edaphi]
MRPSLFRRLLPCLALCALAACQSSEHTATYVASQSPEAAVQQSIALVRAGDFAGFWQHALPPHDYAMLREDWGQARAGEAPLTDAERARIDTALEQLAAPDAAATLDGRLQPWLADAQARYGDQLPLLVGIGRALAGKAIEEDARLSDTQKRQAVALVNALGPWAQQAPWFDPARARQAVGVVVATARELDLRDAQSLRAMDFDQAMRSYAIGFHGLERMLALYGLPLDEALASARVVPLEYHPPYARVRIEYQLAGTPLSMESMLVQQNGRWYDQDLLESVRQAHRTLAAPAASGTVAMSH